LRVACDIRIRVFVDEQGFPLEEELDDHDRTDPEAVHALAYDEARGPLGTGRFFVIDPATVQIGRMAVLADARGQGTGAALLSTLVAEATRLGFSRARLWSQTHARGFYLKKGFYDDGEPVIDAGAEHLPMSADLRSR
jgi:predicted GNAT family N-acyltransferase